MFQELIPELYYLPEMFVNSNNVSHILISYVFFFLETSLFSNESANPSLSASLMRTSLHGFFDDLAIYSCSREKFIDGNEAL